MNADRFAQFKDAFRVACIRWEWGFAASQVEQLAAHFACVMEANERFNLTRITDPEDFAMKHVIDSLAVVRWVEENAVEVRRVLDIGTGAGIPAIPIAVARDDWHVTAVDGTAKKAHFVRDVAVELGLANLAALHARAEHWKADRPFDLVLLKAIGPIERCLRFARPHLADGGYAVLYKTAHLPEHEIAAGARTAKELGFAAPEQFAYDLVLGEETMARQLWIFRVGRR